MSIELSFPFACIIMSITQVLVAKEVNELICSSFQVYLPRCISNVVCNANSKSSTCGTLCVQNMRDRSPYPN